MKYIVFFFIKAYKILISPILLVLFGQSCRFRPTCSEYTANMVLEHGVFKGIALGMKQLSKCHNFANI